MAGALAPDASAPTLAIPEPQLVRRWGREALRRLLRPGYGALANARDATQELVHARQQACQLGAPALSGDEDVNGNEDDAAVRPSWPGRAGAGGER